MTETMTIRDEARELVESDLIETARLDETDREASRRREVAAWILALIDQAEA